LPGPDTPKRAAAFHRHAAGCFAIEVDEYRRRSGVTATVDWLAALADTQLPDFRRK
jgi:hypothetical protein